MVAFVTLGACEERLVSGMRASVERCFGVETVLLDAMAEPAYAFDVNRTQYNAGEILKTLNTISHMGGRRVLAVTNYDLFIPLLRFVFGLAQVNGRVSIVSLARLRQECYGLPPNETILERRARKEALHELGHAFGLVHCTDTSCAMVLSTGLEQLDAKNDGLCESCVLRLQSLWPVIP